MRTLHSPRRTDDAEHALAAPATPARANPWFWLAGGSLLFFLVPLIGTDLLGLQPDMYYLIYFTIVVAWFAVFVNGYAAELHDLWRHHLGRSLAVGAVAGAGLVAMVLSQASTDHPSGWRFGFEILWRGLVYGSVDALTLFVFPAAVAYLLMHGNRDGAKRKAGFAGLALLRSLLVSTSHHLGYPEYRDADLRSPLIGTIVANVPTAPDRQTRSAPWSRIPWSTSPRWCTSATVARHRCCRRRSQPTTPATETAMSPPALPPCGCSPQPAR
jgi:hypothetical protein